ncbi:MAG: TIGR00159 family protein [Deltaproteobacteria bacterium]|nr:TIGR00159 family protein [Deltaproteobacteria bacterium]MBW2339269.1 TIGR00159 family protein [Deltaproteobacteria bacterium]
MHLFAIITNLRFQDVLDVLFLTMLVYYLYLWFWGTKAFKALVGLLALGIVFTLARFWGLFLTTWVFQILWQVLIVLIIILFQSEIRQVLERVNPLQMIGLRGFRKSADWIPNFVTGVFSLAKQKIGALIIFERLDRVEELITGGVPLEGEPISEILLSIFQKESPLHDGAVLIRKGRVAKVACYLPLSSAEGLPKQWGTRHRAALGLSERCDAWVVVVSEERGEISLARGGQIIPVKHREELSNLVQKAITAPAVSGITWWERARALIVRRWPLKIGTLGLVCVFWLLLAGQQNFEVSLMVPLDIKNLPVKMKIVEPVNPEVRITVRGLRKDASTLNNRNVHAEIDLSMARFGNRIFRITRKQIDLPNDRINIVHIEPPQMEFRLREATSKD